MSDRLQVVVEIEEAEGVSGSDVHAIAQGLSDRLGSLLAAGSVPKKGAEFDGPEVDIGAAREPFASGDLGKQIADVVHEQIASRYD